MTCEHEPLIAELRQALAERDVRLAEADLRIAAADSQIAELRATVEKLSAVVEELRAQINRNSSNSSKPPSSDPPWAPTPPKKKGSGRKPGGQPGHPGHHRARRDPDESVDHFPAVCDGCGCVLSPENESGAKPIVHQVEELPPIRPIVTDHRLHERVCGNCGRKTRAVLPPGVPPWQFGPRIMAIVALLSSKFRLSRRELPKVLADMFGVEMSLGTVQKICERVSDTVVEPVEAVAGIVHAAPVVNADETSFPHKSKKNWLWVATCPNATLFRIHRRRGKEGLAVLMPDDYDGLLIVDRWKPYEKFRRSLCHAHLLRNWREVSERKHPEAQRLGKWAVAETERLLRYHRQFRAGELSKKALGMRMRMLQARYGKLLDDALMCGDKKTMSLAKDLNRQWGALWAYLGVEGAEPTNNAGERRIRPAVLWRRGSFGTWSEAGQRFVERMLTLSATAMQIRVNLFGYLHTALGAKLLAQTIPSLHDWAALQAADARA